MRFTWVALPILMTALPLPAAPPERELPSDGAARSLAPSQPQDPVAVLPASAVGVELTRALKESLRGRGNTILTATDDGTLPAILTRLRAIHRAQLDFAPRLTRRIAGFFPSYATTCPPPAGR